MKKETIVMLGAAAGAGYGYFYYPRSQTWATPARHAVNYAILGGFVAFAYTKVTGD